jgi:low affinity Fe/Cu permease
MEEDVELISARLSQRLLAMESEKEKLLITIEHEEEFLINSLQKKLQQLLHDK